MVSPRFKDAFEVDAARGITNVSRQCDGQRSSSCDLVEIQGGCSDTELYAGDRVAADLSLTCADVAPVAQVDRELE